MLRYWDGASWTSHTHNPDQRQLQEAEPPVQHHRGIVDARLGMLNLTGEEPPTRRRPRRMKVSSYAYLTVLLSGLIVGSLVMFSAGKQAYEDIVNNTVDSGSAWETPTNFGADAVAVPEGFSPSPPAGQSESSTAATPFPVDTSKPYATALAYMGADVQSWWEKEFPRVFGKPLEPLAGGVLYSNGVSIPNITAKALECGVSSVEVAGNAFYSSCYDGIVYDDSELFQEQYIAYGDLALGVIVAHEWGHAVQARTGWPANSVTVESQADCFAGAWLASFRAGPGWGPKAEESLPWALLAMADLADASYVSDYGQSDNAHGSMFDRLGAMTEGMQAGTDACAKYTTTPPQSVLVKWDFSTERGQAEIGTAGELTSEELAAMLLSSVEPYWQARAGAVATKMPTIQNLEKASAACLIPAGSAGLAYCPSSNTMVYGDASQALPLEPLGDMSYVLAYTLSYLDAYKAATGSTTHRACLAGEWFRFMLDGKDPQFSISPPDVDEATWMLLAADWAGTTSGARFEPVHVGEFRKGVLSGCGVPFVDPVLPRP